jgi:methenyltetrahydromethanopterin cyclohydrolase
MLSVNELALEIFDNLADLAEEFNACYHELDNGARIVDCGVSVRGGYAAGRAFTEICMGAGLSRWATTLPWAAARPGHSL